MRIQDMFYNDINRNINGVIKVNQDTEAVTKQEVEEYVITRELKKHFISFFNNYDKSFSTPTSDIGVWISGFFGSGKSHFLKILSYILENKEIDGATTVERFRPKFEEDPATFMLIDKCTKTPADTILFNIDQEYDKKDRDVVKRVFARMFYKHLGFYGENLKVAKLEQYIEKKGKVEEFRKVFKEKNNGESWVESRNLFDFHEDEIVETLMEVIGMSETAARNYFNGEEDINISISSLVEEMKEYVKDKPSDYRLLFMIDEVGQFVGADTDMLLNLQSLVERIGSECEGKIWVICTGQEAIDEIIKTRADEFSRIQARFKTRLSLSSASADEVIQKRILKKNDESKKFLEDTFEKRKNEMANLFKFRESIGDIKGFETSEEFATNFPFVPYQFILMQKVFSEIRKHGNAGKHLSGGERSMLSGFQEAAQSIQKKDENAIVPFYKFYDTVHTFLDGSIRRVIERCGNAIVDNKGLIEGDQNVLKLLYMIRYVDDVPAKIDNIIILMADDIRVDKLSERTKIQESLDRLIKQNYIARSGDTYNFLTDTEQDVEREIKNEYIEPSEITKVISDIIFEKIYKSKKFRYNKIYDFNFDKKVDDMYRGTPSDNMELNILTMATPSIDKTEMKVTADSYRKAVCVLGDAEYYNYLESAMKIKKYVRKKTVSQLPKPVQDIIRNKQEEAERYENDAELQLNEAFKNAEFYIDGQRANITGGTPKDKIDEVLSNLVSDIYSSINMVKENAESDADILEVLSGEKDNGVISGFESNREAADEVETYLTGRHEQNLPTNMADIRKRFQSAPYGWREIDIAYVVARLMFEQKITVKYGGETVRTNEKRVPDLLRKKSEIGNTKIKKREEIALGDIRKTKDFLKEFFNVMNIPDDDDGLSLYIVEKFNELKDEYKKFLVKYDGKNYPDKKKVFSSVDMIDELLSAKADNIALVNKLLDMQDDLYDMQEDMEDIEAFFKSQVNVFDEAVRLERMLKDDLDYLKEEKEVNDALNEIRLIVVVKPQRDNYDYKDIPRLNGLMKTVRDGHNKLLDSKREDLMEIIRQCMEEVHKGDNTDRDISNIIKKADTFYTNKKEDIRNASNITLLESYINSLWSKRDNVVKDIQFIEKDKEERRRKEIERKNQGENEKPLVVEPEIEPKDIKKLSRQMIFPARVLESEDDIKEYVNKIEKKLIEMLNECDGIDISN